MDQEALVDLALEDGARLDFELRRRGIALDTPIAAYDLSIEQWALLFGIPPQLSRRHVYEEMQSAISTLGLTLSLDQIVLVKNSDPGLRELKSAVPAVQGRAWQSQFSGAIPGCGPCCTMTSREEFHVEAPGLTLWLLGMTECC
jgi:hypothetical protein